jgi:plastocyanin
MLERIWTRLLELSAEFVTPDWGVIIGVLPVLFAVIVLAILVWVFRRIVKAPPARRGKQRIAPSTPAGIHMPGPSFAPAFAAVGAFLLFLGLVFGGMILILGALALTLTLLYWLREGIGLYDHDIGPTEPMLPVVVSSGPPPGVHIPGPSWRPFLASFGVFALMLGLVFGGWLLSAGVVALIATLVGWLSDAVKEYRETVRADTTGHLSNIPESRVPSRLFGGLVVLILGAAVLQISAFAIGQASGAPGASGAPAASGAPVASGGAGPSGGAASGAPPPAGGPAADVQIQAKGILFVETTFTAPASKPFTIAFDNEDQGTPHNIEIQDASGAVAFKGEVFNGVATKVYNVPALAAGTYKFLCIVHPTAMTGTATIQ